jgi:antiviral helicase SKI2
MEHDEWLIKENILQLRQLMSDQNLQLLPDYEQRISVLKDLGFVDEDSRVELKGKVACEVCLPCPHTSCDLALTLASDPLCRRACPDRADPRKCPCNL